MEKIYKALGALALTVGVMQTAMAEPGDDKGVRTYTIDVKGDTLPTDVGELEFPYNAADRGLSGECRIKLEVGETGKAKAYDVTSCSNAVFQRAAAAFAKSASFDSTAESEQEVVVSWKTN